MSYLPQKIYLFCRNKGRAQKNERGIVVNPLIHIPLNWHTSRDEFRDPGSSNFSSNSSHLAIRNISHLRNYFPSKVSFHLLQREKSFLSRIGAARIDLNHIPTVTIWMWCILVHVQWGIQKARKWLTTINLCIFLIVLAKVRYFAGRKAVIFLTNCLSVRNGIVPLWHMLWSLYWRYSSWQT